MDFFKENGEVITAVVAIVVSIVSYWHGIKREKRIETIKALSEIRINHQNERDQKRYLKELEFFATGVNSKVYSINICRKMSGRALIKDYDNWAEDYIKKVRLLSKNQNAYIQYEQMIKKLKRQNKILKVLDPKNLKTKNEE